MLSENRTAIDSQNIETPRTAASLRTSEPVNSNSGFKQQIKDVMLNSVLPVKIHPELLVNIVTERQIRNKYRTNKLIKNVGFFYVLKALSNSGIIKHYRAQLEELCLINNCSVPTFYSLLKGCEALGYLKRNKGTIVLSSFAAFSDTFDQSPGESAVVKFEFGKQKINHVLELAYLKAMEQKRAAFLNTKIRSNPELLNELANIINPDANGDFQTSLKAAQTQALKKGHAKIKTLFRYNADLGLNTKTLRERFNFKSNQSVAYLKAKLSSKDLLKVIPQRIRSEVKVNAENRIKALYTAFDRKDKVIIYVLPDKLNYASI